MAERSEDAVWDEDRLTSPHTQPDKARRVQAMFDAIAPTYERVNTLASAGRDRYWRREMVRLAKVRPDDVLLDVCCGTGDVARTFAAGEGGAARPVRVIGVDFSAPMLELASGRPIVGGDWAQADALRLPLADGSVTIATCAFGIRNFQDLDAGLAEMARVIGPSGRAIILEFGVPTTPVFRALYRFYVTRVMPRAAAWVSRDRTGAYRYLPSSVLSFHGRDDIVRRLQAAGFAEVTVHPLSLGIVAVYRAIKPGP